jgi:hypothetical protein
MYANMQFGTYSKARWASLDVTDTMDSFVLQERQKNDRARVLAEAALCFVAALLIFCAYLQILFPHQFFGAAFVSVPMAFSISAIAIGLALYAFGTRGYVPELGVDKKRKEIWICKLNSKGRTRMKTRYSEQDIKSVIVKRPTDGAREATLFLRLKSTPEPIRLVHGDLGDIEAVHRVLCDIFRTEKSVPTPSFFSKDAPKRGALGKGRAAHA